MGADEQLANAVTMFSAWRSEMRPHTSDEALADAGIVPPMMGSTLMHEAARDESTAVFALNGMMQLANYLLALLNGGDSNLERMDERWSEIAQGLMKQLPNE